jgi:hypothetical protein
MQPSAFPRPKEMMHLHSPFSSHCPVCLSYLSWFSWNGNHVILVHTRHLTHRQCPTHRASLNALRQEGWPEDKESSTEKGCVCCPHGVASSQLELCLWREQPNKTFRTRPCKHANTTTMASQVKKGRRGKDGRV